MITNTGSGTLNLKSVSIVGTDFVLGDSPIGAPGIPSSIPAGGIAGIPMTFLPTATGHRTATLVITDDAAGSPHQIQLTGMGVTDSPHSATVAAGQTATYQLNLAAAPGFTGTYTFNCSGLPAGASCNSTPLTVTGPVLASFTLSVSTTAHSATFLNPLRFPWTGLWCSVVALFGLLLLRCFKPRLARSVIALPALLLLASILSCGGGGGGGGTPSGTYTVVLTGTAAGDSRTTNLTLIVQ